MDNSNVDPELKAEFIDEATESLGDISQMLVELENTPDDNTIIQSIFRPIHSIKGNSAYFGLLKIKTLSHKLETVFDQIRNNILNVSPQITDILLRGIDTLREMLERVRGGGEEVADQDTYSGILDKVAGITESEKSNEIRLWKEAFQLADKHPFENISDEKIRTRALQLAQTVLSLSQFSHVAAFLGKSKESSAQQIPPDVASFIAKLNSSESIGADELHKLLFETGQRCSNPDSKEKIDQVIADVKLFEDTVGIDDPVAKETIATGIKTLFESISQKSSDTVCSQSVKKEQEKGTPQKESSSAGKTMRIPEESIDRFLSYVGDLITINDMYHNLYVDFLKEGTLLKKTSELNRVNKFFAELSDSLQASIMNIRKVPLSTVLGRAPVIVRETIAGSDKKIETILKGEKIKVDKSLLEVIESPFVHMLRNAADHGIEPPEKRTEKGKQPVGTIEITVTENSEELQISIKDDGRGFDHEKLRQKAIAKGLISEKDAMAKQSVENLIFMSGISTAEKVTDVSGRGVGMDVVKNSVEKAGGKIRVESVSGEGSTFTISLPKTVSTQILYGFVVNVMQQTFVIPMDRVVRSFKIEKEALVVVKGKGRCIKDGEKFYPVISLRDKLCDVVQKDDCTEGIIITAETKGGVVALKVDNIENVRQVVLKEIGGIDNEMCLGGALMGNGQVAMVIDIDSF